MTAPTTKWERAGFGLWRRERGAILRVRTHMQAFSPLTASVDESLRLEVTHEGTTVLRDVESDEAAAMRWCDRWAEILIRERNNDR